MPTYGFQIALANRFFDACHSLSRNINRSCGLKIEILRREWDCINVLDKFCLVRVVLYLGMVRDTISCDFTTRAAAMSFRPCCQITPRAQ